MLKRLVHSKIVQRLATVLAYRYCRLVGRTSAMRMEPDDFHVRVAGEAPAIFALWHGQHLTSHLAWPPGLPMAALISRNQDAEINAMLAERLGVTPIRGSGGRATKMRQRGGAVALREMLRTLAGGSSLVLTADVPKMARRCGEGIIVLAKLSGRPIYPVAVVHRRRVDFPSWDRASLALPFGPGAILYGDPIRVPADAGPEDIEAARQSLEQALDDLHARAYASLGSTDPGRALGEISRRSRPLA